MSEDLPKRLDPRAIEGPLYAAWEDAGHFSASPQEVGASGEKPYVIVIPPPNVTAVLHMGHGLNNTVQDVLIRWQRMTGRPTLWVPGTDHAGIATQNVIERQLKAEGKTRDDLGREAFVERVWEFVGKTGDQILRQLRAIGASCDWTRTRFTLDEGLSTAVRTVFVELYERGLIYRGEYIINWCPRCLTALSNEEAEGEEETGTLYHLRYPFAAEHGEAAESAARAGAEALGQLPDGRWYLTVSTTRPETMLGDSGVAVYPSDERYSALVGAQVELPLAGRTIPIVADAAVDPEFGTGMVKLTPAHDINDFEIAQRTGVELIDVMTPDAHLNDRVPEAFRGLERFAARSRVVEALDQLGLFAGSDPHTHSVPHCYRCHTVVEPRLSEQWFVRMKPLAEPALKASKDGTITFAPERWKKTYEHWMENIRDWVISRQLWWGHRIPVWYCDACDGMTVAVETPETCAHCGGDGLRQDPDVLDTWFSSWLWPFSTLGWPEKTPDLSAFYPGSTLCTAPEILFFWVARMIMSGYAFMGEPPFTAVYLHGTVRDAQGRKMSKSLGNGIDPLEVVDLFGADALRFTLLSSAGVGTDIHLDHEDVEGSFAPGRNFANKVWNAGRFALMNLGDQPVRTPRQVEAHLEGPDRWILSRLQGAAQGMTSELERFRLKEATDRAYHFFWGDIADWYLEIVKPRLRDDADADSREAARATLVHVLDGALRLLHPLIPFVTEELWAKIPQPQGTERPAALIVAPWPEPDAHWADPESETRFEELQQLVVTARSLRKEYGVGEGTKVPVCVAGDRAQAMIDSVQKEGAALARMGGIASLSVLPDNPGVGAHAVLHNGVEVFIPLAGLIDLDRERERLTAEIERLRRQLGETERKLANANFVERAPAEVVAKERDKRLRFAEQAETLQAKRDALGAG